MREEYLRLFLCTTEEAVYKGREKRAVFQQQAPRKSSASNEQSRSTDGGGTWMKTWIQPLLKAAFSLPSMSYRYSEFIKYSGVKATRCWFARRRGSIARKLWMRHITIAHIPCSACDDVMLPVD